MKDGRKQFENGLPELGSTLLTYETIWGKVPVSQSLVYAFDTNEGNRAVQDVGLDGIGDAEERALHPTFAGLADPAADNYQYYLAAAGGILNRYKNYNGTQGNSPVTVTDSNRGSTTLPDVEDINRDNTMDGFNAYFEYHIDLAPGMAVGTSQYVTDVIETAGQTAPGSSFGPLTPVRWIQFKIPVSQFESKVGPISDFRSIRFMRMYMTGFQTEVTLRFGTLDLGSWRMEKIPQFTRPE